MSISEIAVKRPLLIVVIFTVLILFGFISYNSLNYNLLPKFEVNVISVVTTYRGASANEIESTVTKNIEDAVSSIEGIDKITSTSMEGVSMVMIQLKDGANTDKAQQDAQRKVEQLGAILPDEAERPMVNKFSLDEIPILKMGVSANMSPKALYDLIDLQIKPQLSNVSGVGQINLVGGEQREIQVNLDQNKLQAYKISATQVAAAIGNANQSFPTGKIETTENQQSIKYDAKLATVEQMRNLIVSQRADGSKIYLSDLAEVVDGVVEATQLNHINGKPSIGIMVVKQTDANTVEVSKGIKKKVAEIEKLYSSQNLKFNIASDQSVYTLASADAVMEDLLLAVIIVAVVMMMFLHSLRSSMFVMIALPASIIPTFIFMYIFGFSLNLMTLMALSLVVGVLVDDSIVILENIYRHMEMGKSKLQAALDGRSEIGFTALAITLVDVVVFVPLSLSGGLIGNILREFSLVIVCSTLMSLFVSFTVTPLLASRFGKLEHLSKDNLWGRINLGFEKLLDNIKEQYRLLLIWSLGHKRWIFITTIALLVGSFMLLGKGFIGATFMANGDRGEMNVTLELSPEASLYKTNQIVQQTEKILLSKPEVVKVFSNVGYIGNSAGTTPNKADITVIMTDKHERTITANDFGLQLKDEISKIPGVKVTVAPTSITGNASQANIDIAVKGTDLAKIRETATMIKGVVDGVAGTQYVKFGTDDPKGEIDVKLDRERMSQLGLDASNVGFVLQNAFRGNNSSKFKEAGNEYDIMVSVDKGDKKTVADVRKLTFVNASGQVFNLSDFAVVTETIGESMLKRTDRLSSINVQASVIGRPSGTVGAEIKKIVESKKIPDGVYIEYLGDMKNQADAFGSLGLALIIAIVLVYLIMVALYESLIYPFVVLFAIPVATVGAFLALALTMEPLSIFSIVGMIMLIGLVTKNAILIVDFTNHLKEQGVKVKDALIEAGQERLRPILMTTIAMIFGMLPIALASGAGAEVKNGMAWVIIGGLTSSLLLTLVVVPAVYLVVDTIKDKVTKRKQDKLEANLAAAE